MKEWTQRSLLQFARSPSERAGQDKEEAGSEERQERDGRREGGKDAGRSAGCRGSGDAKGARIRRSSPLSAVC